MQDKNTTESTFFQLLGPLSIHLEFISTFQISVDSEKCQPKSQVLSIKALCKR